MKMAPMLFEAGVQDTDAVDELRIRGRQPFQNLRRPFGGSAANGTASLIRKIRAWPGHRNGLRK